MDFGSYTRLVSTNYHGFDSSHIRDKERVQDKKKVRAKEPVDSGSFKGGRSLAERQALERARRTLEAAGHTIHQVEDLLTDTVSGIRANSARGLPMAMNASLLDSAEETAKDIIGYARHNNALLFPDLTKSLDSQAQKALGAYGAQEGALKATRGELEVPEVRDVMAKTNESLRGEDGVIPKIEELADVEPFVLEETVNSLDEIKDDVRQTRSEIEEVKRDAVETKLDAYSEGEEPPDGHIDLAS